MSSLQIANRTLFCGDNLPVLRGLEADSVDLIYLDPPFNSRRQYHGTQTSEAAGASFDDRWSHHQVDASWWRVSQENPALYASIERVGQPALRRTQEGKAYLIYVALRLLELRRVLKPTGSIYLHCDSTMNHALRGVMDAIFGVRNFRNEIIWQRARAHNDARHRFGRVADTILLYAASSRALFYPQYTPLSVKTRQSYDRVDAQGRHYGLDNLIAPGGRGYTYALLGVTRTWRYREERMRELHAQGLVLQARAGGVPHYKRYLDQSKGAVMGNVWTDIPALHANTRENVGYPTQKPLELLRRLVRSASREGDLVLDPFCGSATTCIAAESLGRRWLGIDIQPQALALVPGRLRRDLPAFGIEGTFEAILRRDVPKRAPDDSVKTPSAKNLVAKNLPVERLSSAQQRTLYGRQEGFCSGCGGHRMLSELRADRIDPRSEGTTLATFQLLCRLCSRLKGHGRKRGGSMADLHARLVARGVLIDPLRSRCCPADGETHSAE